MAKKSVLERINDGELIERKTMLDVECPLYHKRVPIDGTCFDLHSNNKGEGEVRIAGEPDNLTYDIRRKCRYADYLSKGGRTCNLIGVFCAYPKEQSSQIS